MVVGAAALLPDAAPLRPARWASTPARLARMDRLCALALVACDAALLDAELRPGDPAWQPERTAVVLGTAFGCHATNEDYYRGLRSPEGASPRLFAYTLPSAPVGEISIHHRVQGPTLTLAGSGTAALDALASGLELLDSRRADRVLVVAADVATPLLSGLLGGGSYVDAAAALVLERGRARARARLAGCGQSFKSGQRQTAIARAAGMALASGEVAAAAVTRVLAFAEDVPVLGGLGLDAPMTEISPRALGAAPLIAAAGILQRGTRLDGPALLLAGDAAGAGAAALFTAA